MTTTFLAQATEIYNPSLSETIRNLSGIEFLQKFLPNLVTLGLVLAVLAAFFFLLFGGIKWITSGGDKEKIGQAQGMITSALIGLVLVFALWAILQLLENFFGINLVTIDVGPITLK
jgi:hypothetical protein